MAKAKRYVNSIPKVTKVRQIPPRRRENNPFCIKTFLLSNLTKPLDSCTVNHRTATRLQNGAYKFGIKLVRRTKKNGLVQVIRVRKNSAIK
jgi:hypothetical protein